MSISLFIKIVFQLLIYNLVTKLLDPKPSKQYVISDLEPFKNYSVEVYAVGNTRKTQSRVKFMKTIESGITIHVICT